MMMRTACAITTVLGGVAVGIGSRERNGRRAGNGGVAAM